MFKNWRIGTFNGVLLAAYFIPSWATVAYGIMIAPVHALYERPSISVALFIGDHLQLASTTTVRVAWLLALARFTAVAFFAIFLFSSSRASIRKTGGCDEALALALAIASTISFASMCMASQVGETAAFRLHATELLMLLGAAIVLAVERPARARTELVARSRVLALEQSELSYNR